MLSVALKENVDAKSKIISGSILNATKIAYLALIIF
jgi:hypothetical protein